MLKKILGSLFITYWLALKNHLKNQAQTCLGISMFLRCVNNNNKTNWHAGIVFVYLYFLAVKGMHRRDPVLWDSSTRWVPLASQLTLSFLNKQLTEARDLQIPKTTVSLLPQQTFLTDRLHMKTSERLPWSIFSLFLLYSNSNPVQMFPKGRQI